ncbi:MAG: MazG nucleotide pyrophosphohydrolase domain-containing protein [Gemmatimonadales bacterium]
MSEGPPTLGELAYEINKINRANGWEVLTPADWDDPRRIPTVIALIHSEASEALEGFRKGDRENVAEELADVLIRVLDAAGGLGIDIDNEVQKKLAKNRTRGFKHGGKVI